MAFVSAIIVIYARQDLSFLMSHKQCPRIAFEVRHSLSEHTLFSSQQKTRAYEANSRPALPRSILRTKTRPTNRQGACELRVETETPFISPNLILHRHRAVPHFWL